MTFTSSLIRKKAELSAFSFAPAVGVSISTGRPINYEIRHWNKTAEWEHEPERTHGLI